MALIRKSKIENGYSGFLFSISPLIIYFIVVGLVCSSSDMSKVLPEQKGSTVTYILGEDHHDQTFYTLAKEYFLMDNLERTDKMVVHIRSIEGLIDHLNSSEQKLARIELVTHGNVWSGLSAKILDGGERSYPKDLLKAKLKNELPLLKTGVIDRKTEINLWGCGIGRNPIINIALDKIFTDSDGLRPRVKASEDFVIFRKVAGTDTPIKLSASYWPYFFKRGYRPSESLIQQKLNNQFPETDMDWQDAFSRDEAENDTASFVNSFNIPVSWTVIYEQKEDRPSVTSDDEKMSWIRSQKGLIKKIDDLGIPIDKYKWTVNKIIHTDEKGKKVPAIKAIGMSTVLCVVKPNRQQELIAEAH